MYIDKLNAPNIPRIKNNAMSLDEMRHVAAITFRFFPGTEQPGIRQYLI